MRLLAKRPGKLPPAVPATRMLSKRWPKVAPEAELRPKLDRVWLKLADVLQRSANFGRNLADFDEDWPNAKFRTMLANPRQHMAKLGQCCSQSANSWLKFDRFRPKSAKSWPARPAWAMLGSELDMLANGLTTSDLLGSIFPGLEASNFPATLG